MLWILLPHLLAQNVPSAFADELGQSGAFHPDIPKSHQGTLSTAQPSPTEEKVSTNEPPILQSLKGIVFVNDVTHIQKNGRHDQGMKIEGIEELNDEEFLHAMEVRLGKPVALHDLEMITQETVVFMRSHNRPVVDAIVPEQNVSSGTLQILVIIGKLGKLSTENNHFFTSEDLIKHVQVQPGELIEGDKLMDDLRWINQNPFRQTDLVYTQGDNFGETDIILRTADRFPIRVYTGYENSGTELTGYDRLFTGFNWGRPFGCDHLMNYQFTANTTLSRLSAHSFSYFIPLAWRHKFWVFGSYSSSSAKLPQPLELKGTSWCISNRYIIPFRTWHTIEQEFTLGYDLIKNTNNLLFANVNVANTPITVSQLFTAYEITVPDDYGYTKLNASLRFSPGNFNNDNTDTAFQKSRAYSKSQYVYTRLEAERATRLPYQSTWLIKARSQFSNTNLVSSEQLSFGGATSVRGYDANEVNADEGYIVTNEFHAPSFSPLHSWAKSKTEDSLIVLGFWDYACASNLTLLPKERAHISLSSVGAGIRYHYGAYFSATLDWGFQLLDSGYSTSGSSNRIDVSITASY